MLHEFIAANRAELITRCRQRSGISDRDASQERGVPLFLDQVIAKLQTVPSTDVPAIAGAHSLSQIGRDAGLRGAELLKWGYTVEEVVHEYGNVCQAVTELAIETTAPISNEEFKTLNRCLDDAIADAVTSYARADHELVADQQQDLHTRVDIFAQEHRRLIDIATQAFSTIRSGTVGSTGATGSLLAHALMELRELVVRAVPEIHRAATVTVGRQGITRGCD